MGKNIRVGFVWKNAPGESPGAALKRLEHRYSGSSVHLWLRWAQRKGRRGRKKDFWNDVRQWYDRVEDLGLRPWEMRCPNALRTGHGRSALWLYQVTHHRNMIEWPRLECKKCGLTFSMRIFTPFYRMHLSDDEIFDILRLSAIGKSIRSIAARMNRDKNTVMAILQKAREEPFSVYKHLCLRSYFSTNLFSRESGEAIDRVMQLLKDEHHMACILFLSRGKPITDLAVRLGVTQKMLLTAEKRIQREPEAIIRRIELQKWWLKPDWYELMLNFVRSQARRGARKAP